MYVAADDPALVDEELGYDARLAARIVREDVGVALADLAAVLAEVETLLLLQLVVLGQHSAHLVGQDDLLCRLAGGVHLPAERGQIFHPRFRRRQPRAGAAGADKHDDCDHHRRGYYDEYRASFGQF